MKKDGIQTRNRKLATKAKKRRAGMHDFFKPFDSRLTAMYSSMGTAAAAAGYLNPMSQYYAGQMSPFMTPSTAMALNSSGSPTSTSSPNNMNSTTTPPESCTGMSSPSPSTSSSVMQQGAMLGYPGAAAAAATGAYGGGGANGANPLVVDASA